MCDVIVHKIKNCKFFREVFFLRLYPQVREGREKCGREKKAWPNLCDVIVHEIKNRKFFRAICRFFEVVSTGKRREGEAKGGRKSVV